MKTTNVLLISGLTAGAIWMLFRAKGASAATTGTQYIAPGVPATPQIPIANYYPQYNVPQTGQAMDPVSGITYQDSHFNVEIPWTALNPVVSWFQDLVGTKDTKPSATGL